jgi:hypothetical protein
VLVAPNGVSSDGNVMMAVPSAKTTATTAGPATDGPHQYALKTLTAFDAVSFFLAIGVAGGLAGIRKIRHQPFEVKQLLHDALNVGTIAVLLVMVLASLPIKFKWIEDAAEAAQGTSVVDIAFVYCIVVIITSMTDAAPGGKPSEERPPATSGTI